VIDFAKKKSDIISILDGSYEYKDRKKISDICNKNKLKRLEKEQKVKTKGEKEANNVLMVSN